MRATITGYKEHCGKIDVSIVHGMGEECPTVHLSSYFGPCQLNFHMTATQARKLAAALIFNAEQIENDIPSGNGFVCL